MDTTISCSLELPTKSNTIRQRLQHNYRNQRNHENVINDNQNYIIKENEIIEINVEENQEENNYNSARKRYSRFEQKCRDENFARLKKTLKEQGKNKPIRKRLNPLLEGVVHFGGVYEIGCEDDERIEKTQVFNKKLDTFIEDGFLDILKENLKKIEKEFDTEISDIVLHRDEKGLNHFHFMIKNYNEQGLSLDIGRNKNKIGTRVQDIICENMEQFNLMRGEEDSKKQKMTKQQLIEFNKLEQENKLLKKNNQILKSNNEILKKRNENLSKEYLNILENIRENILELSTLANVKKADTLKKKLNYILSNSKDDENLKIAIDKLFSKTEKTIIAIKKKSSTTTDQ